MDVQLGIPKENSTYTISLVNDDPLYDGVLKNTVRKNLSGMNTTGSGRSV